LAVVGYGRITFPTVNWGSELATAQLWNGKASYVNVIEEREEEEHL
jgi:hypothetical protein